MHLSSLKSYIYIYTEFFDVFLEISELYLTLTKVPEALVLAKDFLSRLPLNCPALASELSGMGMAWLESPNAKAGVKGLAGDLHAVSAIRISKSKSILSHMK